MKRPPGVSAKDIHLLTLYGITEGEKNQILDYQGGVCFGCHQKPKTTSLHCDHTHWEPSNLRGLLCWTCNKTLAYLRDSPEIAERLAIYLRYPPAESALGFTPQARPGRSSRKWRTKREKKERMAWVQQRLIELGYKV